MPPSAIRAVALDLWGTLIVDAPGGGRRRMQRRAERLTRAYERAGAGPGAGAAVPIAIRAAIDALVVAHQSNIDLSGDDRINAVRHSMLEQCPSIVENDALIAELINAVCESASWEPPDIIEGVEAELDRLKRCGLKLAVVSNTGLAPGCYVERALVARGLGRWIDHWIWSDEVLSWKPGEAIFQATLNALGTAAGETIFVGDTPEADILGSQHAGFAVSVLVGDKGDEAVRPDLALPSLRGLADALSQADILPL